MEDKPPLWADLLLTGWVLVVAVFFFGVYSPSLAPFVSQRTDTAGLVFYTLMLLAAAVTLAIKYLRRRDAPGPPATKQTLKKRDTRTKNRKTR